MKNKLNLIPLSKAQMKKIMGGENPCPVGNYISQCYCGTTGPYCIPANGGTPAAACYSWCLGRGYGDGTANGNTCVTSCPGI